MVIQKVAKYIKSKGMNDIFLVVITEYDEYRRSQPFLALDLAKNFMDDERKKFTSGSGWEIFIEIKTVI